LIIYTSSCDIENATLDTKAEVAFSKVAMEHYGMTEV